MKQNKNIRIIFSGGGTGGHIFPALSIADEIRKVVPEADILFVGARGKMEMDKVPKAGYRIVGLPVSAFHRRFTLKNLVFPFKLLASLMISRRIIRDFKPDLVIGTGGFASGPILRAAVRKNIPTLLQEQNSLPGVTNRLLAGSVSKICVAWPGLDKYFPHEKIVITGNPVRDDLNDLSKFRTEARTFFALPENGPVVLVFGGSLGARTLNLAMGSALNRLANDPIYIIWQTGTTFGEEAKSLVEKYSAKNIRVFPFISEMNMAYAAADLVVCRAGAITLSELAVAAKPSMLVPYPHAAEDHQTRNAEAVVNQNAARMIPDHEAGEKLVDAMLALLNDKESLKTMSDNIARLAHPEASSTIAREALGLVGINIEPEVSINAKGNHEKRSESYRNINANEILNKIKRIYFLGIGGIGMSALARHFINLGKEVSGYDRTSTPLTRKLEDEGMKIHYSDNPALIPSAFSNPHRIPENLIIYTPAIPANHSEKLFLSKMGYHLYKRSEVLGMLSREDATLAIAGSHGKSTVSSMLTQICWASGKGCNAFLGAISKNLNSNYSSAPGSGWSVIEADEFDRSFLHLSPWQALVTSMDEDHLDIYKDANDIAETFTSFINLVADGSAVILKSGLAIKPDQKKNHRVIYYSLDSKDSHYYASNIVQEDLGYRFDLVTPQGIIPSFETHVPGRINVENAVAASAMALEAGFTTEDARKGIAAFTGLNRRFDIRFNRSGKLYMDDYAHHPNEIHAMLNSTRELYPGKRILGIFQPHLYTRTRDLAHEFSLALGLLDELILLDIYPARELPIPGVSADLIGQGLSGIPVFRMQKDDLPGRLSEFEWDVLLTIGAGDIDQLVDPITQYLESHVA